MLFFFGAYNKYMAMWQEVKKPFNFSYYCNIFLVLQLEQYNNQTYLFELDNWYVNGVYNFFYNKNVVYMQYWIEDYTLILEVKIDQKRFLFFFFFFKVSTCNNKCLWNSLTHLVIWYSTLLQHLWSFSQII